MKVLVVGGAGYIGSHVVLDLIRAGHTVVVADNLSTGLRDFVHPDARFHLADITKPEDINKVFSAEKELGPIDVVMHFAAKLDVAESVEKPLDYYHNNVEGVRVLLGAMLQSEVKKIVFSSTAAVYGESQTNEPICEGAELAPINPYGASKLAAEQLIQWASAAHGLNYAILRYFNAAGADDSLCIGLEKERYTHLIPRAVRAAMGLDAGVKVFGDDWPTPDGTCIRDYIHVSDLSSAHLRAAEYLISNNQSLLVNLGTETGSSVKEVITAVDRLRTCPFSIAERRPGDPALLIADVTLAREVLGWRAQRDLIDIVGSDFAYREKLENPPVRRWS